MDNGWTLDGQSLLPFLPASLELLSSICYFLPFSFEAVEVKLKSRVQVEKLEPELDW